MTFSLTDLVKIPLLFLSLGLDHFCVMSGCHITVLTNITLNASISV